MAEQEARMWLMRKPKQTGCTHALETRVNTVEYDDGTVHSSRRMMICQLCEKVFQPEDIMVELYNKFIGVSQVNMP